MNGVTSRLAPPTISGCAVIAAYTCVAGRTGGTGGDGAERTGQTDQRHRVRGRATAVDADVGVRFVDRARRWWR